MAECYIEYDTADNYTQEYYRIFAQDNEVKVYDILFNYHFSEPMTEEDNQKNKDKRMNEFKDIKGVSYEVHTQPYMVSERIIFKYDEADFKELYDLGFAVSDDGSVPTFISFEATLNDLKSEMDCQDYVDNEASYFNKLVFGYDMEYGANQQMLP